MLRDVGDSEVDQRNFLEVTRCIQQLPFPKLHVVGNHDQDAFSLSEIEQLWAECGQQQEVYGALTVAETTLIWLDFTQAERGRMLSQERLEWLDQTLEHVSSAVVVSHFPIVIQDIERSIYFRGEEGKRSFGYTNHQDILEVLTKHAGKIITSVSGHVHWLGYTQLPGWTHCIAPAFSEKITALQADMHPQVYSTLEILRDKITWKSYSKQWCLSTIEVKR